MQVEANRNFRLHSLVDVTCLTDYLTQRSITKRLRLPHGKYYLIPTTYAPDHVGNFMLRLASPKKLPDFAYALKIYNQNLTEKFNQCRKGSILPREL